MGADAFVYVPFIVVMLGAATVVAAWNVFKGIR